MINITDKVRKIASRTLKKRWARHHLLDAGSIPRGEEAEARLMQKAHEDHERRVAWLRGGD
jgi:hypothetical protein